jgi:hypothetical protein
MSLDKTKVDEVIQALKDADVTVRLKAIEEASSLHKDMFKPDMSIEEYAYSALVCESLYNITRDILKENFKKLTPSEAGEAIATVKKNASVKKDVKKKKADPLSDPAFLAMFAEIIKPKESNVDKDTRTES